MKTYLLILGLLTCCSTVVNAQDFNYEQFLKAYNDACVEENVYVHTDRDSYQELETIWFQVYTVSGIEKTPSSISNNVYVQIYSDVDSLLMSQTIRVDNGIGAGQILLNQDFKPGKYKLIAFTNWMRNFGDDLYFSKPITVSASDSSTMNTASDLLANFVTDIQFLPESGVLIEGVPSKVAFKAINQDGLGIDIKGVIINTKTQEEFNFQSEHLGMGSFFLTPSASDSYMAKVDGYGSFPLPNVNKQGTSLKVITINDSTLKVNVFRKGSVEKSTELSLVAQQNGNIFYSANLNSSKTISIANISTVGLKDGIIKIALFDSQQRPLSERIFFVSKDNKQLSIHADKTKYGIREKVKLALKLNDGLSGTFSLSAYDLYQSPSKDVYTNIYADLLLKSELKGHIESPAYYFDKSNEKRKTYLDLVMLTHGWRKYNWKDSTRQNPSEYNYSPERGITVSGKAIKPNTNNKGAKNSRISFLNKTNVLEAFREVEADKLGNFIIENLLVYTDDEIILKGDRGKNKSDIGILLNNETEPSLPLPISLVNKVDAISNLDGYQMKDFTSPKTKRNEDDVNYTKGNLEPSVFWVLQNKYRIFYDPINGNAYNFIRKFRTRRNVTVLVNMVPIDMEVLKHYNMGQVKEIKNMGGRTTVGGNGSVINITLKDSVDLKSITKSEPSQVFTINHAYNRPIEFYSPKYDIQKPEHIKPDQRVLLHWQPMIEIKEGDETKVEFWTTDLETTIMVNVQGLGFNGRPFNKTLMLETRKN